MKILITGATGYVGDRLLPKLLQSGHEVTCMVRDASRFSPNLGVQVIEADVLHPGGLPAALQGIEVAYYLIHSMGGGAEGFAERDRRAARKFRRGGKTGRGPTRHLSWRTDLANFSGLATFQEPPGNRRRAA